MKRLLSLPAIIYVLAIWVTPAVGLVAMSFRRRNIYGGFDPGWSTDAWAKIVQADTLRVLARTVELSLVTTVLCLVLAYLLASLAVRLPQAIQYLLMTLFALPIGVDMLVKVFGWSALMSPSGLFAGLFEWTSLNAPANVVSSVKLHAVFVLIYLPLAVLPVWVAVRQVDPSVERAARDSGASALQAFAWVVLPLSRRGRTAAVLLVWVSSLTNFLIPDLVGGAKTFFLGNLIKQQFFEARNWPLGAALGGLALVLSLLGIALLLWLTNFRGTAMPSENGQSRSMAYV